MTITPDDLATWRISDSEASAALNKADAAIAQIQSALNVVLPEEYCAFLTATNDHAAGPPRSRTHCLAHYLQDARIVRVSVLYPAEQVIEMTRLSRESIYAHRTLLPDGLIIIGSNYDDNADACIVYDTRITSVTYLHVFNWRYYADNLVAGDGLGVMAVSLQAFLHTMLTREQVIEAG